MKRIIIGSFFILSITIALWIGFQQSAPKTSLSKKDNQEVQTKEKAPQFVLTDINGKKSELITKGKPTVINFWASWCGPCKIEMPMLQKAYEKYKDEIQFQMVNITIEDDTNQVKRLIDEKRYTFPVLLDQTGEVSEVYQVFSIPTTYIIDQNGYIHKQVYGAMTEKQLEEMIAPLRK